MTAEPLPWPMIPGSPLDLSIARLNLTRSTFGLSGPTESRTAVADYSAALRRYIERNDRLAARPGVMARANSDASGAEHELAYYGGTA